MKFENANDIKGRLNNLVGILQMGHVDIQRIFCIRSYESKSKALARIWSFPKIWQSALNMKAHYVIEVISNKFDKLSKEEQDKTLIHELMHIPKSFGGGLVPHKSFGKHIDDKKIEEMYKIYKYNLKEK
ncbi:MAG: metallopeptidase [Candidatus Aenigmarchaeota archaeon]|nr:metallopeptidase [Candidatus Aenigmarchaeota archaeon]